MFKITFGKGFHITFENGYTISVQWGPNNYCENYSTSLLTMATCVEAGRTGSKTAECTIWKKTGESLAHPLFKGEIVGTDLSSNEILELMNWAASQPNDTKERLGDMVDKL